MNVCVGVCVTKRQSNSQGNVEIETYWLKGKRDKDGNAQAACPQFETQTISKATISAPDTAGEQEGLVRLPCTLTVHCTHTLHTESRHCILYKYTAH